jgi:hypothetical protein
MKFVDSAKAVLPVVFNKVEDALKRDSRMFPNGIDLIKLTLKTGTNYEFSVVIAGKAVPSVEEPVAMPEQK